MAQSRLQFAKPPVVETVLGVQFAPLKGFTSGHAGRFWGDFLGDEWSQAADATELPDQFETFGEQRPWSLERLKLQAELKATPPRLQIANQTGDRLIQIQPTRFIYNWQKKEGPYPNYHQLRVEFHERFASFRQFAKAAGLGEVALNQWEVAYVDSIPKGDLWQSLADWHRVLPGLFPAGRQIDGIPLEAFRGEWHCEIAPRKGRLHLTVHSGRDREGVEILMLQTTARGPVGKGGLAELDAGFDVGHAAAVQAFDQVTSTEAQEAWGRVR